MLLPDVNILLYAFNGEAPNHNQYLAWLEELINGDQSYGMASPVLSGFLRIATHPRILSFSPSLDTALTFVDLLLSSPHCVLILPGRRHWQIFTQLCRASQAKGALIADAYLAALAIESRCEWITTDRDFARFPGLRWRHPFDG